MENKTTFIIIILISIICSQIIYYLIKDKVICEGDLKKGKEFVISKWGYI